MAEYKEEKAMREFVKELAKLSKKTGITVSVCGGLQYTDPKEISGVEYDNDFFSGDMYPHIFYNVNGK